MISVSTSSIHDIIFLVNIFVSIEAGYFCLLFSFIIYSLLVNTKIIQNYSSTCSINNSFLIKTSSVISNNSLHKSKLVYRFELKSIIKFSIWCIHRFLFDMYVCNLKMIYFSIIVFHYINYDKKFHFN